MMGSKLKGSHAPRLSSSELREGSLVSGKIIRRTSIVLGALVVLAIVAFGPSVVNQRSKNTTGPALAQASARSFPVTATASGTLLPQSLVTVNFPISGQV